jgi:drug/metabolite transporter (DMT)-like permease
VTYLLPVVAIVLGVVVLSEQVTAAAIAGTALVLTGVALTRRAPPSEVRQTEQSGTEAGRASR